MKSLLVSLLLISRFGLADIPDNAAWTKLAAPAEAHKKLAEMTGKWNYSMKWWAAPNTQPMESKGKSTAKMILGGRFLQEEMSSKSNGQEFNGIGFTGFDNLKQEYQGLWLDNMGTSITSTVGKMDNGVMKSEGTMSDPMSGEKNKWFRTTMTITDKNTHTYAMFAKDAKGNEFQMMEIVSTRTK